MSLYQNFRTDLGSVAIRVNSRSFAVLPFSKWRQVGATLFGLVLLFTVCRFADGQQISFADVTDKANLHKPLLGIMGHGGAWGDVDGDGHLDVYIGGFADRPAEEYEPAQGPPANVLLRNNGDGTFSVWDQKSVQTFARTSGAVFADLDNDGDVDLYVANNAKSKPSRKGSDFQNNVKLQHSELFRNDNGKLVNVTGESGACPAELNTARNVGVLDYNADGLLDLFIVEDKFTKNPRSVLLKNLGELKFKEANEEAGLPDDIFGLGLAVADVNDDGRPDFFVGHSNRFFVSDGTGGYREDDALNKTFAWSPHNGEDWPCGAAFGDLNRDGRLDLVLSIHAERARNQVYVNTGIRGGVPQFVNVTKKAGLPEQLTNKSPHVELQDFDNDGRLDIYLSTALLDKSGTITPLIYRNVGNKEGVPQFEANWNDAPEGSEVVYYPAGPSADYDNDGRVDLLLINWFRGNHTRLLHNTSEGGGNWLNVKAGFDKSDATGVGIQIKVYAAGKLGDDKSLLGFSEITTGYGYASGQPVICHFGLGDIRQVDLVLRLPKEKNRIIKGVDVNQTWVVDVP